MPLWVKATCLCTCQSRGRRTNPWALMCRELITWEERCWYGNCNWASDRRLRMLPATPAAVTPGLEGRTRGRTPMVRTLRRPPPHMTQDHRSKARGSLDAEIIIANAPDPVFVADLEGKILQANDAVSELLGFRPDELLEQSLSR